MIINKNKETNKVIIFLHIPKTAGKTLNGIIENQYKDFSYIKSPFWWKMPFSNYLDGFSTEEMRKIEVLRGHFHFGIHKLIPQKNYTYITILRDPIEQVISHFYYIRSRKTHRQYDILNKITFNEFITNDKFDFITHNMQTRYIAGKNYEDNLEEAKNNLKKFFSIVGITERFDETLFVMNKTLSWKIYKYKTKNVTPNKPSIKEISDLTINILKKINRKDIELYKLANTLLDNQIKQLKI